MPHVTLDTKYSVYLIRFKINAAFEIVSNLFCIMRLWLMDNSRSFELIFFQFRHRFSIEFNVTLKLFTNFYLIRFEIYTMYEQGLRVFLLNFVDINAQNCPI